MLHWNKILTSGTPMKTSSYRSGESGRFSHWELARRERREERFLREDILKYCYSHRLFHICVSILNNERAKRKVNITLERVRWFNGVNTIFDTKSFWHLGGVPWNFKYTLNSGVIYFYLLCCYFLQKDIKKVGSFCLLRGGSFFERSPWTFTWIHPNKAPRSEAPKFPHLSFQARS